MSSAWIFPGQGSQVVGMGRELYDEFPAARAIFDRADQSLGFALSRICFEGPADMLTATENAQPALLTTSVALLAALGWLHNTEALTDRPSFVAGHSLGEYSALVAAQALPFETALHLVRRRGELMAAANQGAMAAVIGLAVEPLQRVCREASEFGPVVVANENAPDQLVISGASDAVARASELAQAAGAKRVVRLNVSAAFHSPLMADAATGLSDAIDQAEVRRAMVPVVANVTALPISEPEEIRAELKAQVTAPVRWIATIDHMAAAGVERFIEVGPGSTLSGLVKRIAPSAARLNIGDAGSVRKWMADSGNQA